MLWKWNKVWNYAMISSYFIDNNMIRSLANEMMPLIRKLFWPYSGLLCINIQRAAITYFRLSGDKKSKTCWNATSVKFLKAIFLCLVLNCKFSVENIKPTFFCRLNSFSKHFWSADNKSLKPNVWVSSQI